MLIDTTVLQSRADIGANKRTVIQEVRAHVASTTRDATVETMLPCYLIGAQPSVM